MVGRSLVRSGARFMTLDILPLRLRGASLIAHSKYMSDVMLDAAAEIERLSEALKVADEQAAKVEALLEPHVEWEHVS